jgi:hypothetical protein
MVKTTCRDCDRSIQLIPVGDRLVAVETELIEIVPASRGQGAGRSPGVVEGRRPHSALCLGYREEARRNKVRAEMREYTARQAGAKVSKRRRPGL